ncbi:HalD/BesD family halogenase [Ruegeria arenilitoris]|uniref:HalD/BesD family halogenase n=1 Tax=Ruegeria arenilitoris TaxID=1173585 RepID=UPI00147D1790|nr:2OG-Fe(II) oxygenase [Ruegeria arenilitoris]
MLHDLVDLGRYPIDRPDSPAYDRMIEDLKRELDQDGCAVLPGFVHETGIELLLQEADTVAPKAHRSFNRTNAYFTKDDPRFGIAHPIRRFCDRSNAFVPADNFPASGPLRRIYEFEGFLPFIREALGEDEDRFFRYDDPLADVIINVVEEGQGFPWHFDTNNYTVTLAIQNGEEGGAFEYAPNLRSTEDENFDAVASILDGNMARVRQLELQPGDLQIFRGRYSLHRVAPVKGDRRRYVGIFSFVEAEGMCGGVERTRQLYGRVLPHHYEREGLRKDQLLD